MLPIAKIALGQSKYAKARRSSIHGRGLFARKDIPEGERIIQYTGEKITKAEGNRRYDEQAKNNQIYLFELNSRYDIDGSAKGNIAKYANHSCDPNAETIVEKGEIWLVALKDIQKGEEITFDYNFPLFDYEKRPCKCGSEGCRQWIINQDSYYYLRRKKSSKKGKGVKPAKKATEQVIRKSVKKSSKAPKKAAKKATKPGKKAPKKAAKKATKPGKKAAKKATKPGKKAAKKGAKKATKPGKRAAKKTAKKAKKAKKAGKRKSGRK